MDMAQNFRLNFHQLNKNQNILSLGFDDCLIKINVSFHTNVLAPKMSIPIFSSASICFLLSFYCIQIERKLLCSVRSDISCLQTVISSLKTIFLNDSIISRSITLAYNPFRLDTICIIFERHSVYYRLRIVNKFKDCY